MRIKIMQDAIIIEAGKPERHYWLDLWRYRELFRVLVWRDLAVRYKQTVIGVLWALIRPILTMLVFTIIFGRIAKLPTDGSAPYAILVFAGILPWTFFSTGLSEASNSLIRDEKLISKVYFPRLIMPIATVAVALVDFLISFCVLVIPDDLVRVLPRLANRALAAFRPASVLRQCRPLAVDHFLECKVSRLSLRSTFFGSVWSVHIPGRI
jgi:hypothetical protein